MRITGFQPPRAAFALKKKKLATAGGGREGGGEMSFKIGLSSNQEGQLVGRVEDTRVHDDDTV